MCIIYFAFNHIPDQPLILIANRDEYFARPTAAAAFWNDFPDIFAGRDLLGGGTWLGVTKSGRFAALTNFRESNAPSGTHSRGELVTNFLTSEQQAIDYLREVESIRDDFSGFNLIVGEIGSRSEMFYYSNRADGIRNLPPGIYGLSNHLLDTPWPKVVKGKERFTALLRSGNASFKSYFDILSDRSLAPDEDLPSTGIPFEAEKALSAVFIKTTGYGTRCSTVLRFNGDADWEFKERVFV